MPTPTTTQPNCASALGLRLRELFSGAERDRRETEQRWLADLRQYKGQYDPEVLSRLHPRRSKAFVRLTRAKVKSVDARLMDLLFPGNGKQNWSIEATPVPELAPEVKANIAEDLARRLGRAPDAAEIAAAHTERARRAGENMAREMRDQLAETRYRETVRDVIHSGNLYGTGVLKGPMVETATRAAWAETAEGWQQRRQTTLRPYIEFVPLWDIYPDMRARDIRDAGFVFQRHLMSRHDLEALARRGDFDGEAIREHLASTPRGDAGRKAHETALQNMGDAGQSTPEDRFEVLEFWGFVPAEELGVAEEGKEVRANVWLLGETVVKAAPSHLPGSWPYYFYHFDKDETSIFGEGLASIMRDPQQLFNASVRALLDNAAISAGPQIEVNMDLLPENEDPTDIHPFRIWLRAGGTADASAPAVRVFTLPSYTQEFMSMARMFEEIAHETTGVPSALAAEFERGAGQTARGLSMLLAHASVALRDQVRHFDDGVTRPFVTELFNWNMRFNPKEEIRGDFAVTARGLTTLVAKELYVEQLDAFAEATRNALDAPWIRRGELLRRMAQARDLDEDVVRTDDEVRGAGERA